MILQKRREKPLENGVKTVFPAMEKQNTWNVHQRDREREREIKETNASVVVMRMLVFPANGRLRPLTYPMRSTNFSTPCFVCPLIDSRDMALFIDSD